MFKVIISVDNKRLIMIMCSYVGVDFVLKVVILFILFFIYNVDCDGCLVVLYFLKYGWKWNFKKIDR